MIRRLSGFELAVHLSGLMLLAALFAGHRLAVFGLVALPLLGNTRNRPQHHVRVPYAEVSSSDSELSS